MSIVHKILPRVNVLVVTFADGDSYSLRLVRCRDARDGMAAESAVDVADTAEIRKELTAFPVLVLVGGYGVITRQIDTAGDIVAKVTAEGSGFLCTHNGGDISFLRGEQLKPLWSTLEGMKAKIVTVRCARLPKDAGEAAAEYAGKYYSEHVNIRTVLKTSAAGSAMARLVASKLRLPVLGLVLITLMINAMVSPDVRAEYEAADAELSALRKTIGQADDVSRRRQELIREYGGTLPHRIAWLCDRAAMSLPDGITLTSLSVQPPLRSIESNKKTTFALDVVEIAGESRTSAEVSDYMARLNGLGFASQVRLASMEQDRENGLFNFKIVLEL